MFALITQKTKKYPANPQTEKETLLDLGAASEVTKVKLPNGFETEFPFAYKGF